MTRADGTAHERAARLRQRHDVQVPRTVAVGLEREHRAVRAEGRPPLFRRVRGQSRRGAGTHRLLVASVGATHRSPAHEKTTQRPSGLRGWELGKPTSPDEHRSRRARWRMPPNGSQGECWAAGSPTSRVLGDGAPRRGSGERQASWRIAAMPEGVGAAEGGVAFAQVSAIIEFMAS